MSLSVTVAICTLGTHPRLPESVAAVIAQSRPDIEILVVDNAPATGETLRALAAFDDPRLRIVAEPARGLSRARNRALEQCRTDLLAFTDDDAIADSAWVDALVEQFREPTIGAVTGAVHPAAITTRPQQLFEEYVGFDKGDKEVRWSWRQGGSGDQELGRPGALFPYAAGKVGSGNNMAFRTARLKAIGGFDVALGAGTLTRGGEDLDAFSRLLLAGDTIVYTPHALVQHHHRESEAELRQQIFGQGSGMGAVLVKSVRRDPRLVATMLGRSVRVARQALHSRGHATSAPRGPGHPREHRRLVLTEMAGLVAAPVLYWRSASGR